MSKEVPLGTKQQERLTNTAPAYLKKGAGMSRDIPISSCGLTLFTQLHASLDPAPGHHLDSTTTDSLPASTPSL